MFQHGLLVVMCVNLVVEAETLLYTGMTGLLNPKEAKSELLLSIHVGIF